MKVHLQYGKTGLEVEVPSTNVDEISPEYVPGIVDEHAAFIDAVRSPIACGPLRESIGRRDRVAVVIPDITRALPSQRLLPWLFEELAGIPPENFTIIIGTGSHRTNTPEELAAMVGTRIASRYRIVNHNAHDPATLLPAGRTPDGHLISMNREYVEAGRRILLGFIEPHFMAGFSGGYKAAFPGVAGIESIMRYHRAEVIGHPRSTWGVMEGNPTQEQIRSSGSVLPVDFLLNVTLNRRQQITGFFCGEVMAAHAAGCEFAKRTAMVPCSHSYTVVVTTNGGHPLDMNLYQSVKGMSAAAQIVSPGGLIIAAARCGDGFPEHGNFRKMLFEHGSPREMLETIMAPGFTMFDQWQVQLLALILMKSRVGVFSEMAPELIRRAHLEPVEEIGIRIAEELERIGKDAPIAVLPEGPMTIPYLAE